MCRIHNLQQIAIIFIYVRLEYHEGTKERDTSKGRGVVEVLGIDGGESRQLTVRVRKDYKHCVYTIKMTSMYGNIRTRREGAAPSLGTPTARSVTLSWLRSPRSATSTMSWPSKSSRVKSISSEASTRPSHDSDGFPYE